MIDGGYVLKARKIKYSKIAHAPPHVREIWDWLIMECNHADRKVCGRLLKRGECFTSYNKIKEGLSWFVGWRKMTYTKHQVEGAMKTLRKADMITTTKTTRGIIVSIANYDYYQTHSNYNGQREPHVSGQGTTAPEPQTADTIHNELNAQNTKHNISGNKKAQLEKQIEIKKNTTPTKQLIAICQDAYRKNWDGEMLIQHGKDAKILRRLWLNCLATDKSQPLAVFRERVGTLFAERDINSIGGLQSFWNAGAPKKVDTMKAKTWTGAEMRKIREREAKNGKS